MSQKKKNLLIHNNIQAFSLGLAPEQTEQALVTPSQKRVSQYKKIRKRIMREREAKVGKYNSPKGERKRKSLLNRRIRESKIGKT
jgi:hypothetical protein